MSASDIRFRPSPVSLPHSKSFLVSLPKQTAVAQHDIPGSRKVCFWVTHPKAICGLSAFLKGSSSFGNLQGFKNKFQQQLIQANSTRRVYETICEMNRHSLVTPDLSQEDGPGFQCQPHHSLHVCPQEGHSVFSDLRFLT